MALEFSVIGAAKAIRDTLGIGTRMRQVQDPLRASFKKMEDAEQLVFAGLGGRYVNSGAVKRSLTEAGGEGAVREEMADGVKFGTSIWYAHFLTEHVGPPTDKGGLKRPPPSAVLKLTPALRAEIGRDLTAFINGGTRL